MTFAVLSASMLGVFMATMDNRHIYHLSIDIPIKQADRAFYTLKLMKTLGERIRDRLEELKRGSDGEKYSQYWLADQVGIKQPSINVILNGKGDKDDGGTKHVIPIARALGVTSDWLWDESGPKFPTAPREAILVGYVGAGAVVYRDDSQVVQAGVEPPPGYEKALCARIRGDSMFPLREGWLVFYTEEHRGIPDDCINKLCVVGLEDGGVLIKVLRRQGKKLRLQSWNADTIEDAKVIWASRVIDIRPI
jgi:hypothetical protein